MKCSGLTHSPMTLGRNGMINMTNMISVIAKIIMVLGAMCSTTTASVETCELALGDMHGVSEELEKASTEMWAGYELSCQASKICEVKGSLTRGSISLNFRELRANDDYADLRKKCLATGTDEMPTTLCKVDTEMKLQNVKFPYTVRKEPVCWPFECREDQVELVETYPMGCDPKSETCGIITQKAVCPDRPTGAGTGNCNMGSNNMANNRNITQAKAKLVIDAEKNCEGVTDKNPGNSKICSFEKASIDTVVTENFRPYQSTAAYRNYLERCYDAEGQTCFLSMTMKLTGNIYYDINGFGDYNDIPGCFPASCEYGEKEEIMKERVGKLMGEKISNSINNSLLGGGRRLHEVETALAELASRNLEGEKCPLGMKECTTTVVDFYCTNQDGIAIKQVGAGSDEPENQSDDESSPSTIVTTEFFSSVVSLAMSIGMLL